MLPKKKGRCNLNLPKYYFDRNFGTCLPFLYGGCQGNSNNFDTHEECQDRCSVDTCDLAKEEGPCNLHTNKWAYNNAVEQCEIFSYGGCGGNENKFDSKAQCEGRCLKDICKLPEDKGPCSLSLPRWFYNKDSGKCEPFIYGGCRGNFNNFSNQKECEESCRHESDKHFFATLSDGEWLRFEETTSLKELYPTYIPLAYHDPVRKIIKEAGLARQARDENTK